MTTTEALIAFIFAAGLVTITPGLDTVLVLRTATVEGGWRALLAGVGICAGCLTWGVIAALGLGAVLAASEIAYTTLRWAGAAYLFYLGCQMIISGRFRPEEMTPDTGGKTAVTAAKVSATGWLVRGFATNILNPKVGVFYITFLPQFVPIGADVLSFTVILAGVHALEGILWFAALIAATRPLVAALSRPHIARALDRVTGGVFIVFGCKLLLDTRHP